MFQDRKEAGRVLAPMVAALPDLEDAVVLGLPRGGVPVAFEIARGAKLPLDILMVRKLGAPGQPELAVGAVASGGILVTNPQIVRSFGLSEEWLRSAIERESREISRREIYYRDGNPPLPLEGVTAILVDDGLATGATMRAAARAIRSRARKIVIAVPVAARSVCRALEKEADCVLCAAAPEEIFAVGQFYYDFAPTTDEEVRLLLGELRTNREPGTASRGIGTSA